MRQAFDSKVIVRSDEETRFFADSEKTAARSAAKFAIPVQTTI